MVITDDNFATIVGAVEQGRIIVHNILRFIHYLFSSNLAEIVTMFAAVVIGWPLPLGVLQILWLNLVTDIFPAMALALEPSAPEVMQRPPRDPKKPLMTARFGWLIVWQGTLLAACTLGVFAVGLNWYGDSGPGLEHAETLAFMTLALAQVFHAFNARSQRRSAFTSRLFTNGWLWAATAICTPTKLRRAPTTPSTKPTTGSAHQPITNSAATRRMTARGMNMGGVEGSGVRVDGVSVGSAQGRRSSVERMRALGNAASVSGTISESS
jgi:magnesium-transporting ATPase (P-type)